MLNLTPETPRDNRKQPGTAPASINAAEIREAKDWLAKQIGRAKKVGLFMENCLLTPAVAQVLLDDHNARNRHLRHARAQQFADIIDRGEWMLTTQGISVAADGILNNGQHRCMGVVLAKQAVPCMFGFGETPKAFAVIDTQATRTAADVLSVQGFANSTALAAATKLLSSILGGTPRDTKRMTHQQIMEALEEHAGLHDAVTPGVRFAHNIKRTSAGAGTVAHYLIKTRSPNADKLDAFWERLCTGIDLTAQRDPILVLRNALINGTIARGRSDRPPYVAAGIINAWNLWSRRKQTVSVIWQEDRPFPEVI